MLKLQKAFRTSVNTVKVLYLHIERHQEFLVEWCNIHPSNGKICNYGLQLKVLSDSTEFCERIEKAIEEGEIDSNPDIDLYLEIRDTFDSQDCEDFEPSKPEIKNVEIVDNAVKDPLTGLFQPSEISVLVEFEISDNHFYLDYKTTTTLDYGAYSSNLWPYDGSDSYTDFEEFCRKNGLELSEIILEIKREADVQYHWKYHIDEKYVVNDDHYGGMDANSEINEMKERED